MMLSAKMYSCFVYVTIEAYGIYWILRLTYCQSRLRITVIIYIEEWLKFIVNTYISQSFICVHYYEKGILPMYLLTGFVIFSIVIIVYALIAIFAARYLIGKLDKRGIRHSNIVLGVGIPIAACLIFLAFWWQSPLQLFLLVPLFLVVGRIWRDYRKIEKMEQN